MSPTSPSNVLCAFYERPGIDVFASEPRYELPWCNVHVVNTFCQITDVLQSRQIKYNPFDIVMMDEELPIDYGSRKWQSTSSLLPIIGARFVKGVGIFVSKSLCYSDNLEIIEKDWLVVFESARLYYRNGQRNWHKMHKALLRQINQIEPIGSLG
jgi:hypothetical protein